MSEQGHHPVLFADWGCAFAQRVLALLDHLERPIEVREAAIGTRPDGLREYSVAGRMPLLVHGDVIVTESRVMLEYLAETYGHGGAYPDDLGARAAHRNAMAVVDAEIAPRLFTGDAGRPDEPRLEDALRALDRAIAASPPEPNLLTFHVAPIWLRFRLWHPGGATTRAIEGRGPLRQWLDAAVELGPLKRSTPDPATHVRAIERARRAGLLPTNPSTRRTP